VGSNRNLQDFAYVLGFRRSKPFAPRQLTPPPRAFQPEPVWDYSFFWACWAYLELYLHPQIMNVCGHLAVQLQGVEDIVDGLSLDFPFRQILLDGRPRRGSDALEGSPPSLRTRDMIGLVYQSLPDPAPESIQPPRSGTRPRRQDREGRTRTASAATPLPSVPWRGTRHRAPAPCRDRGRRGILSRRRRRSWLRLFLSDWLSLAGKALPRRATLPRPLPQELRGRFLRLSVFCRGSLPRRAPKPAEPKSALNPWTH
jgi:hypothetical protein